MRDPWYVIYPPQAAMSVEQPKTVKKIERFRDLPRGWHYGRGVAADGTTIARAKDIFNQYAQMGFSVTDAFPGQDGEIMVTAYRNNYYVECIVQVDGTYSVVGEKDKDVIVEAERGTEGQTIAAIVQVAKHAWNIFGSYIPSTTMRNETSSKAWHSRILQMTGPPQYFYADAWTKPVVDGVATSGRTISR